MVNRILPVNNNIFFFITSILVHSNAMYNTINSYWRMYMWVSEREREHYLFWSTPPPVGFCTALCSSFWIGYTPPGTGRHPQTSLRHTHKTRSHSSHGLKCNMTNIRAYSNSTSNSNILFIYLCIGFHIFTVIDKQWHTIYQWVLLKYLVGRQWLPFIVKPSFIQGETIFLWLFDGWSPSLTVAV